MPVSGSEALEYFVQSGFSILDVKAQHVKALDNLPAYHKDPFDRLLVVQAISEPLILVSHDEQVLKYSKGFIKA
jgi:PIN domain nuclease of toxin-antitoxin system